MCRALVVAVFLLAAEDACALKVQPSVPLMIIPVPSPSPSPEPPFPYVPPCTYPHRPPLAAECLIAGPAPGAAPSSTPTVRTAD